ncbi:MAG: glycoside hydrolase family 43 protein [Niabella sp.]
MKFFGHSRFLLLLLIMQVSYTVHGQASGSNNPFLADPTVFYHKGVYYLYGTGGENNRDDGFIVFTSTDKKNWQYSGFALKKGESYGNKGFWAPQVFEHKGRFYMAYTANEHIAIAEADSPLGPFTQKELKPLDTATRMIDPFIFFDSGKIYLYHVRLQEGNRIFVAELSDDLATIQYATLKECIYAAQHWEDTQNVAWKVAEGPTVLKHKGLYYLIYSANDFRNPDYALGYAVSDNPAGPWRKYEGNPILSRKDIGINGTGHGDVFMDGKGKMLYVFHLHNSNNKVSPRKTGMIEIKFKKEKGMPDKIVIKRGTFRLLNKK